MMDESGIRRLVDAGWTVERTTQRGQILWRATRPGWLRSAPTLEDLIQDCERVFVARQRKEADDANDCG